MFFLLWVFHDLENEKMDGWMDFQADGAAHQQPKCRTKADNRRSRSIYIGNIHTINREERQAVHESVYGIRLTAR
jgi:hypothetical protein